MALLLNRKYGSRIECLHSILKTIHAQGKSNEFQLNDLKYDSTNEVTILDNCPLLKENLGYYYCPYLDNSLDNATCYATQSVESDSTKSKAVSDTAGSLEALGLIRKNKDFYEITDLGIEFVETDYLSNAMEKIIEKAVLSYGPILGLLHTAYVQQGVKFKSSKIYVGYPKTKEPISNLKLGSTNDSVSRTRSKLISWCLTAGFIELVKQPLSNIPAHKLYRDILNKKILNEYNFNITSKTVKIFKSTPYIENPLFYSRLNKNVGSKRERNGAAERNSEKEVNPKLLMRRYFLIKLLNYASNNNLKVSFNNLVNLFRSSPIFEELVLDKNKIENMIASELEIGRIVGLPFEIIDDKFIKPISIINESVLEIDAPTCVIQNINDYIKEDKYAIFVQ